uniref:Uncharacterized protein n=1 Tax=viral metagenome TaxID=1070528 RepID=A0A6M3J4T8_9ZZZZ
MMEAKDTVMSDDQIHDTYGVIPLDDDPVYDALNAQAEISFKAGRKEVVDWGKETCPHDLFGEGTHCFKRACDECWEEKWGIQCTG